MKHNSDVPGQLALFAIAPTVETRTPVYDPFWDEPTPLDSHSVGGQILESEFACESVGEQVTNNTLNTEAHSSIVVATDTKKSAPQHDTHWIEKYWVERSGNKYWYFRYCWMTGRKINRLYLGSVDSVIAKRKKADVEIAIADGKLPADIEKLIRGWKNESPTMPKVQPNNTNL